MAEQDNRSVMQNGVRALNGILAALGEITTALQNMTPTTMGVSTVSGLPDPATAGQGARRLVTDANSSTFGTVVTGGGSNILPVFSTGVDWRLG
jgi:hypothetical protein